MPNTDEFKKGDHEKAMERAKKMIDKGEGITNIMKATNLKEEDIIKAKEKWVDQS